ncbi:S41 family peptidase [Paradesulfitobacterium ferrireducens]|uniref:S41 family peptidase n=1 Tax=Paradesulfitobacterium ferrireducens TaxID=2816476 RepID=UPI001A90A59A|nr:S41 family peptidase [Paradesulfitobacterium ferrireducens]
MKARIRASQVFLGVLIIIVWLLSPANMALAADSTLSEVRSLLESGYVDPVSHDVLTASTVEQMLDRLGDPHTMYFNAQEYQDFINSMDNRFSGIGIHIEIVPAGVQVLGVISGSPAEAAGMKAGDIIVQAAGQNLAGLAAEEAVSILRGPEGSQVDLQVKRGNETVKFTVTRQNIEEPTVKGELLNNHIGYIELNSFGSTTAADFGQVVNQLRAQQADRWIIDVRNNPGGYLNSAIDLAGYFIGKQTVVNIKYRDNQSETYQAVDHGFTLNQPVFFLTNENSASASEILSAAVKDHGQAVLVGTRTYGKGTVQSMFPLSNGGVLKMTVARFYSPLGYEINKVGVAPDLQLKTADHAKEAAELLLTASSSAAGSDEYTTFTLGAKTYNISLARARSEKYWQAWGSMSDSLIDAQEQAERWQAYYPGYQGLNRLTGIPLDKKFTVHFRGQINWEKVNSDKVELIDSADGRRVPISLEPLGDSDLKIVPQEALEPGASYWLVIHPEIEDIHGVKMQKGALAVAETVK